MQRNPVEAHNDHQGHRQLKQAVGRHDAHQIDQRGLNLCIVHRADINFADEFISEYACDNEQDTGKPCDVKETAKAPEQKGITGQNAGEYSYFSSVHSLNFPCQAA